MHFFTYRYSIRGEEVNTRWLRQALGPHCSSVPKHFNDSIRFTLQVLDLPRIRKIRPSRLQPRCDGFANLATDKEEVVQFLPALAKLVTCHDRYLQLQCIISWGELSQYAVSLFSEIYCVGHHTDPWGF